MRPAVVAANAFDHSNPSTGGSAPRRTRLVRCNAGNRTDWTFYPPRAQEEIELASCATGIPNKLFLSRHPVQRMQPERDPLAGVQIPYPLNIIFTILLSASASASASAFGKIHTAPYDGGGSTKFTGARERLYTQSQSRSCTPRPYGLHSGCGGSALWWCVLLSVFLCVLCDAVVVVTPLLFGLHRVSIFFFFEETIF